MDRKVVVATRPGRLKLPFLARVVEYLSSPMVRNGYALVLSSASTSLIGMLYWVIAARLYTPRVIGLNSAAVSALMFLAGVAQLNLASALIRFIPVAGRFTRRLVVLVYLISLGVALLASLVFLVGVHLWSPNLSFLSESPGLGLWFVLATMAWCIFVLQDAVLTGLRRATWVPVENTVFSLVKIALLVMFALSIPGLGIFASWTLGLIASLLVTNVYIFLRLISKHEQARPQVDAAVNRRSIARFAAADYLGALLWLVATTFLPVIVTTVAGPAANATYFLAWTIAYSLYLVSPNIGSSLIVEAAGDAEKLASYGHRAFRQIMQLVLPGALLVLVGAPLILSLFGKGYTASGSVLLRLLAISAVPNVYTALFVSIARVQRRMQAVVITLGVLSCLVLGISYFLLQKIGIVGVGYAWLIGQTLVAGYVYFTQLRPMWADLPQRR